MIELDYITDFYGDKTAERSKVPLINHIHEGLAVLRAIGAKKSVQAAFCLHPMVQADGDLFLNLDKLSDQGPGIDRYTLMLVMEYRNQANAWLSDKVEDCSTYSFSDPKPRLVVEDYRCIGEPTFGPLPEVREMLIADKVQNYKDFRQYHLETHPLSKILVRYFETWLKVLDVTDREFIHYCVAIDIDKQRRGVA